MQDCVKLFVKICAETMGLKGQIYEFGSLQVSGQEGFADLRAYFPDAHYLGCDMRTGPGVDRIEDLEKGLSFENACATTVLCMGTLEHVFDVFKAMSEMKRIVKDEGVLIISLVFNCDIHAHPCDYWRFTPECFLRLLSGFDVSLIGALGKPDDPESVFGVGVKTKNRGKYLETLNMISKRYSLECETAFRYDKDLWRKAKLAAYKDIQPQKIPLKNSENTNNLVNPRRRRASTPASSRQFMPREGLTFSADWATFSISRGGSDNP